MKKFRQLAALFLAFVMVIGAFSTPKVAKAEETLATTSLASSAVLINYVDERLEVTKLASETVYYTMKYTETSHAKTAWEDAYEATTTKAYIDFSNTSAAKDVKFYLTTDTAKKPIEITVKAQETTLVVAFSGTADTTEKSKIKLDANWTSLTAITAGYTAFAPTAANPWTYGYLNVTVGKGDAAKAMTAAEATANLEFRKGTTGVWQKITDLDVRKFTAYGAQLYFRIAATNTTTVTSGSAITTLGRASKEVKVTYSKQANAPKVSINGVTKEVKLAKNQEYRVGVNGTYTDWISVADNHMTGTKVDKVYLKDLLTAASGSAWTYDENKAGQSVQIRVAASEKGIASKVGTATLNQASTPSVGSGSAVTFELVKNTTYAKGIKVTNTTGQAIQVAVVSGSSYDVNKSSEVKWVNVAVGKNAILSGTVLAAGDKIIYRTATIKDDTKTAANEFVVSSKPSTYDFKTQLPLADQTFSITKATATATVTTVSPSAVIAGTASPYTVTVTNTASASAITVVLDVTTANVVAGTPTVVCVSAANDTAPTATASKVKLVANGAFTASAGTLKITIAADAAAETKIFRVTLDGKVTYVTVDFKTN
jgi:hypothetical protein